MRLFAVMASIPYNFKGGKTKCDERKDDGNVGKELMERELGEIEGAEGCHNQM